MEQKANLITSVLAAIFGGTYKTATMLTINLQATTEIRSDIVVAVAFYAFISAAIGLLAKLGIESLIKAIKRKLKKAHHETR